MNITLESVLNDALKLPPEDRERLLDRLHESLGCRGGFSDPQIEQAWIEEAERRTDQVDRGEVTPLTEEEFRRRLWAGRGDAEWVNEVERRIDQMDRGEARVCRANRF